MVVNNWMRLVLGFSSSNLRNVADETPLLPALLVGVRLF